MEPNTTPPHDLKDRVLGKIRSGEVMMHSRTYFALKIVALVIVLFLALVVSVLLFSFIFFTVRLNILDAMTHRGPNGFMLFVRLFPWHLLLLDIILIALAEILMRTFRFAYGSPTLYLLVGLIACVLALGLFIDRATSFNDDMRMRAHSNGLPEPLNDMYEHIHRDDLFPPGSTSSPADAY
ncbi:MAG TPA: hypothetical protein VN495_03395 [Candidatus Paceibacterota bacterium]|nr:hypothetical protein [Candidatus Paceibacterota bacterium]